MKFRLVLFMGVAASSSALATEPNDSVYYEAGVLGTYLHTGAENAFDYDLDTVGGNVFGTLVIPIGRNFGARVDGGIDATTTRANSDTLVVEYDAQSTAIDASASLFYRLPNVGRVRVGYGWERTRYDVDFRLRSQSNCYPSTNYCSPYYGFPTNPDPETTSTYSYLASLDGYIGPVTLGVRDERVFYDAPYAFGYGYHVDYVFASIDWYVTPNVRLAADVGFDDARRTYVAGVEFQPPFMRNWGSFSASYLHDAELGTTNGIRVGVTFFFDKRFDLKTRDRQYR